MSFILINVCDVMYVLLHHVFHGYDIIIYIFDYFVFVLLIKMLQTIIIREILYELGGQNASSPSANVIFKLT